MLLLLSAWCVGVAAAMQRSPAPDDTLRGMVTDAGGGPLAGASVLIAELERRTVTTGDGRFALGLPPGRYRVLATLPGYRAIERSITAPYAGELVLTLVADPHELVPLTVTAARSPIDIDETPLSTAELDGTALGRAAGVSLAAAIDRLPGVRDLSTGAQIGKPMIRGLVGSRVLVLENGLRLEDYAWSDEDGPSVDVRLADRVEVVRGPASLLYGSDAIGGVINVLSAPLPNAEGGPARSALHTEVSIASNNAELSAAARFEQARGRVGFRVEAVGRRAADLRTPAGELDNTGFGAVNGELALGLRSPKGTTELRVARYGGVFKLLEAGGTGPDTGGGGPERKLADTRLQLRSNYVLGAVRLESRSQWQHHSISEVSDEAPTTAGGTREGTVFDLLLDTWSSDLLLHHAIGPRISGTIGLSGSWQNNDSRGPVPLVPDARIATGALFLLERMALGRVSVVAGLRGDLRHLAADADSALQLAHQTRDYTTWSGSAGVVLHPGARLAIGANVGRAWRAPNLFELFANGPRLGEARFEIGSSTLRPERSLGLDLNLRWRGSRIRVEIAGYRNRIRDFIYGAPTPQFQDSLRIFRYGQTDATLLGGEASLEVDPLGWLTMGARVEAVRGTDDRSHQPLPLMPPARWRLTGEAHAFTLGWLERCRFAAELELVARQGRLGSYSIPGQGISVFDLPTPAYALVNLEFGGDRQLVGQPFQLALAVHNLAGTRYRDYLNRYKEFALNPGRNVTLKLGMDF